MTSKRITLDHIDHHDTKRMEYFLNALDEELRESPFDWKEMEMAERLSGACRFVSTASKVPFTITIFFCDSYAEALDIAKANFLPNTPKATWSVNGSLMYLVESDDEERLGDILSIFAGRE